MKARLLLSGAVLAGLAFATSDASAISRDEVMVRGRAYAVHRWSSTASNQTASCSAPYKSLFPAGDYVGLPYGWGGYMSLFTFDQDILSGYGAGAQETDGVLDCIAGVDCSGFVSMAWTASHHTTSDMADISPTTLTQPQLLPGDVFNKAGYHVAMFMDLLGSGNPHLIEAAGYNTHFNSFGGWSYVSGYIPRRYQNITGTSAVVTNPDGTTFNPIPVSTFPYSDSRNTANSLSRVLDGCGAAPSTPEKGPEYIYALNVTTPGALTVSVTNDVGADMDVELLDNLNTTACKVRNDKTFTANVGCGTYYVVVDTFGTDSTKAGNYTVSMSIAASAAACGSVAGPPAFNPKGKLGDACAYPGHDDLPFCNPNLGADTCIYGSASSFCSKTCATAADCGDLGAGGCCQDISGKGEFYCMTKSFCGGTTSSSGASGTTSGGTSGSSGGSSGSSGGSSGDTTSGGTSGGDGTSGDEPGGDNGAGPVKVDGGSGGCSTTGSSPASAAGLLAIVGLALAAMRRRRAR